MLVWEALLVWEAMPVWVGHSCPTPLKLFLILILILILTLILILPLTLLLILILNLDSYAQPHPRTKIRIPPHAPALPESRTNHIPHILQSQPHRFHSRSPRCHPPPLPARPHQTLRPPRRRSNARSRTPPAKSIKRRKRLAVLSAYNLEGTKRHVSPKREQTRGLLRPSLEGRILRPRPQIAGKLRRETGIPPPKSSA
jgi:hypothetical protein